MLTAVGPVKLPMASIAESGVLLFKFFNGIRYEVIQNCGCNDSGTKPELPINRGSEKSRFLFDGNDFILYHIPDVAFNRSISHLLQCMAVITDLPLVFLFFPVPEFIIDYPGCIPF